MEDEEDIYKGFRIFFSVVAIIFIILYIIRNIVNLVRFFMGGEFYLKILFQSLWLTPIILFDGLSFIFKYMEKTVNEFNSSVAKGYYVIFPISVLITLGWSFNYGIRSLNPTLSLTTPYLEGNILYYFLNFIFFLWISLLITKTILASKMKKEWESSREEKKRRSQRGTTTTSRRERAEPPKPTPESAYSAGYQFEDEIVDKTPSTPSSYQEQEEFLDSNQKFCPVCGNKLEADDLFCDQCGTEQTD
ncbi:MAG: zinc-ribbon domain-containing protein [Candidatus Lokiarchaeota archaeon]|nr:zinc-ribbon domain-containing protein [Candidatus Lokiarchaeota archaeon]